MKKKRFVITFEAEYDYDDSLTDDEAMEAVELAIETIVDSEVMGREFTTNAGHGKTVKLVDTFNFCADME